MSGPGLGYLRQLSQPEVPMSALKQVFVRGHHRYDLDLYAGDLERFAAWLIGKGFSVRTTQTHLFRVRHVLRAVGAEPAATPELRALRRSFRRLELRQW